MKKGIMISMLLIAVTASLMAGLPLKSTTQVGLNVALYPKYLISVTTTAPGKDDTTLSNALDIVEMKYSNEDFTIQTTKGTLLYVSYIFSEYEKCHLEAQLGGPMTLTSTSSQTPGDDEVIQYEVSMVLNEDSTEKIAVTEEQTLYSKTKNKVTMINIADSAKVKGEKVYGSFSLVLNPSSVAGENTIIGKKEGNYSSSIVLSVIAD